MPLAQRSNTNTPVTLPPPAMKTAPRASRTIPAARSQRRESLHIADAGIWPMPSEAVANVQASKEEKLAQKLAEKEAERAVEHARRESEAAVEAQRRVVEEVAAQKAAAVLEALEEADLLAAREATDAAARLVAKKQAKLDAQERKARRLSAAAWAERPALAVWPSEEDLLLGTAVPLPATPVQQRYEGRLSRARKVNSERRSVTRRTSQALTPAVVEEEEVVEEMEAEVEEVAVAVAEMDMVVEEEGEGEAAVAKEDAVEAAVVAVAAKEVAGAPVVLPPPPPPAATTAKSRRPSTDADEQAACTSGAANARAKFAAMAGGHDKKELPRRPTRAAVA